MDGSLSSFTRKAFDAGKLSDITIKTLDDKIKANRFILSRSPVFDAMLNEHDTKEAQDGEISITDFDHDVVLEMVRYMYCDEIPKLKEMALDLLVASDKYDLPGLGKECENYLMVNVNTGNFSDILVTADKLNYGDLKNAAINFIIENHDIIFSTIAWKSLKDSNMSLGMEVMERCFQALYKKMNKT